jgi:hypothetical protein
MDAVGYDLYVKILEKAVSDEKKKLKMRQKYGLSDDYDLSDDLDDGGDDLPPSSADDTPLASMRRGQGEASFVYEGGVNEVDGGSGSLLLLISIKSNYNGGKFYGGNKIHEKENNFYRFGECDIYPQSCAGYIDFPGVPGL